MKTSNVLLIGGATLVGYYFLSNKKTGDNGGGITIIPGAGGGGVMPDLSGILGGLGDILGGLAGVNKTLAGLTEGLGKFTGGGGIPGASDIAKIVKDTINEWANGLRPASGDNGKGKGEGEGEGGGGKSAPSGAESSPSFWDSLTGKGGVLAPGSEVRQKIGEYAGVAAGGGFTLLTSRFALAASKLIPHVIPGAVGTGLKFVPIVGWVYAGADVGATAYEFISGKNIAGGWLGQRELFYPDEGDKAQQSENQKYNNDKVNAEKQTVLVSPTFLDFIKRNNIAPPSDAGNWNFVISPDEGLAQRDVNAEGGTREQPQFSEPFYPQSPESITVPVGGGIVSLQ